MITCPKCQCDQITEVEGVLKCQACEHYFTPPSTKAQEQTLKARVDKIRQQAQFMAGLSIFLFVVSAVILLMTLVASGAGANAALGWMVFSALTGIGFWLFLVAQIIHIRANTEK